MKQLKIVIMVLAVMIMTIVPVKGEEDTAEKKYTIHFDANGGQGQMTDVTLDKQVDLPKSTMTHQKKVFGGWSTKKDGKGMCFIDGDDIDYHFFKSSSMTLYALWIKPKTKTYTLTYTDQNIVSIKKKGYLSNHTYYIASSQFAKEGYIFKGWKKGKKIYKERSKIKKIKKSMTFKAVWKKKAHVTLKGWTTRAETSPNATAYINCRINHPSRRTFRLQHYMSTAQRWVDVKAYKVTKKQKGIRFELPSEYYPLRQYSYWRVVSNETKTQHRYQSKRMMLTIRHPMRIKLEAKAAVIKDLSTNTLIYKKKKAVVRDIASTTKLMTAIIAVEHCHDLNELVTVSGKAAATPWSSIALIPGEKIKFIDLLHALLIRSSNGSATALGEHTSGSIKKFSKLMNKKAKELGCKNTHFVNAHGLDAANHHSTAEDLSKIVAYAYSNPVIRDVLAKKTYHYKDAKGQHKKKLKSTNKLVSQIWMRGGKTGYTDVAGKCFAGIVEDDGNLYAVVVLGCTYAHKQWPDIRIMHRYIHHYHRNPYEIKSTRYTPITYFSKPVEKYTVEEIDSVES